MKKFYTFEPKNFRIFSKMKSFLAVALLLLMAVGNANAQESLSAEFAFSSCGFSNAQENCAGTVVDGHITFSTTNGEATNTTKYYTTGSAIRIYPHNGNGGGIVLSINNAIVTKLVINVANGYDGNIIYCNVDNGSDLTAEKNGLSYTLSGISANSTIAFRNGDNATSGHIRVRSIDVVYTIPEPVTRTDNVTLCEMKNNNNWDQFYKVGSTTYTSWDYTTGTYTATAPGVGGALDTIVTLNLTVVPYTYDVDVTINEGENILFKDTTISTTGIYYRTFLADETACGCDSFVTLSVTVVPAPAPDTMYEEVVAICEGQSYTFATFDGNDSICTETNIYIFTKAGAAQGNRDSVRVLYLDVISEIEVNVDTTICERDLPFVFHGYTFDEATEFGTHDYNLHLESAGGCDSAYVHLHLTLGREYAEDAELTICSNQLPYDWRDTTFEAGTESGTIVFNKKTVNGCDSTVTLNLTVNPSYNQNEELTLCSNQLEGEGYVWRDTTFTTGTESGTIVFNRETVLGCDSVVTLTLTINQAYNETAEKTICQGELPYTFDAGNGHDTTFQVGTVTGEYPIHFTTAANCDSIVTLTLTVNPTYNETAEVTICDSELPYTFDAGNGHDTTFQAGTVTGEYTIHFTTAANCDSIVTLNLTVNPTYNQTVDSTICTSALPFAWNDTSFEEGTATGEYTYTFHGHTTANCDSTVVLNLTVNQSYSGTAEATICANELPYTFDAGNGHTKTYPVGTESKLDTIIFDTELHCDSVVILNLTVTPISACEFTVHVEAGENGTILGDTVVAHGTDAIFTVKADNCYYIETITKDGAAFDFAAQSTEVPVTFDSVYANGHTLSATFAKFEYTVTATAHGEGTITATATFPCDSAVVYNYVAATGYHIDSVKIDDELTVYTDENTNEGSKDFGNIAANHTMDVYYSINHYTVNITGGAHGTVTPEGEQTVTYGARPELTFNTTEGCYALASLMVNGVLIDTTCTTFTLDSIKTNTEVVVTFDSAYYQVVVTRSGNGSGTINGNYDDVAGEYICDSRVTFDVIADEGSHIDTVIWNGETHAYTGHVMDDIFGVTHIAHDMDIYVAFTLDKMHLTTTTDGHGTINPADTLIDYGTSATVTVIADSADGYHIATITSGEQTWSNTANEGTVHEFTLESVTTDTTISATFALNNYTVAVETTGEGTVTASAETVVHGESLDFTITAGDCHFIDSVFINGVEQTIADDNSTVVTYSNVVIPDGVVRVVFSKIPYDLTATYDNTQGTVSNDTTVSCGDSHTFVITPNTGMHVESLSVDGTPVETADSYTFTDVRANHNLQVVFAINQYQVTATTDGNGTVTPATSMVAHGGSQTFTVAANDCYHISGITVNDNEYDMSQVTSGSAAYTRTVVDEDFSSVGATAEECATSGGGVTASSLNGGTWTLNTVYASKGKLRVSSQGTAGSVRISGLDLSDGTYTISFAGKGWNNDGQDCPVRVIVDGTTIATKTLMGNGTCTLSNFEVTGTNGTANSTVIFESAGTSNNTRRFYLDDVRITVDVPATQTFVVDNIIDSTKVNVTFALDTFEMEQQITGNGTVNNMGDTTLNVLCGSNYVFNLAAEEGNHIVSYTIDGGTPVTVDNTESYVATLTDSIENIHGDHTLAVDFAVNTYTIYTQTVAGQGNFNPTQVTVNHGEDTMIVVTADNGNGYHIAAINATGVSRTYTNDDHKLVDTVYFNNITANDTLKAEFALDLHLIRVVNNGHGNVHPTDTNITYGENVTFAIEADDCYFISSVKVDDIEEAITDPDTMEYTFTNVVDTHKIEVTFEPYRYVMNARVYYPTMGEVVPVFADAIPDTVNCGENYTYQIRANEGYHIEDVYLDGTLDTLFTNQEDEYSLALENIRENHKIIVNFAMDYYTLHLNVEGEGTLVCDSTDLTHIAYNTPLQFTMTPNDGCHELTGFTINDTNYFDQVVNGIFNWNAIDSGEVLATFSIIRYEMASTFDATMGTVNSDTVDCGTSFTYIMDANEGYHIAGYTIGDSTATYTGNDVVSDTLVIANAANDSTLNVTFAINTYKVTVCTADGGTLTADPETVNHGDASMVTIAADATHGYHIDTITCGDDVLVFGVNDSILYTYAINNITSDTSICASFSLNNYTITASVTDETNIEIVPAGDSAVKYGDTVQYVVSTLNDCHYISTIVIDETDTITYNDSVAYTHSFEDIRANHTIVANAEVYRYIANTSVNYDSLGTITPTDTLDCGDNFAYEVTPITGYHIDSVVVDGVAQTIADSSTFAGTIEDIHADVAIVAYFGINHYTITSDVVENGTITPGDTTIVYEYGMTPEYTITPAACYYISDVMVDGVEVELTTGDSTGGTYTFDAIEANHTIVAHFEIYKYEMAAEYDDWMGTVTTEAAQDCGTDYQYMITAGEGYHIVSYTIGDVTVNNTEVEPNDFTVDSILISPVSQDTNLVVVFDTNTYTVSACTGVNGTLVVNEPTEVNHNEGTTVTVKADYANGYHIVSITDGRGNDITLDNNTDTTYTYEVNNVVTDVEVCATFALNTFKITATAGENGTIIPEGDTIVTYGDMIDFVIEPNHTCYYISNILVDGESVWTGYTDSVSAYTHTIDVSTFDPAVVDHTITTEYTIFEYEMASNAYTEGTVSSATVDCGTDYTYEIEANYGYHIDYVVLDGERTNYEGQQDTATITVTDVQSDHQLDVYFAINHYTVTATAGEHGTIEVAGVTTVAHGDAITYTITPDHCYYIEEVLVNDNPVEFTTGDSTGATYTFDSVEDTMTIHANFHIYEYAMTAEYDETMGTVEEGIANCGTNFTYNVHANEGYHIVSITVGSMVHNHYGLNEDTVATFNVYNVSQDTVCYVEFEANTYNVVFNVTGEGTVDPASATVTYDSTLAYTATAGEGYHIVSITDNGTEVYSNTDRDVDSYEGTIDNIRENHTVEVVFAINQYTITATAGEEGQIVMPGENIVNYGENVNFTIRATEDCYYIDRIIVDGEAAVVFENNETLYTYVFNAVDTDHTIEAQFATRTYTVVVTSTEGGSVDPSEDTTTLNCGDNATYTFTPDEGYEVVSVTVNGTNIGAQTSYTISNIMNDYTIDVVFGEITYTLTSMAYNHGTIDPMGDTVVAAGSTVAYTLTPEECYTVSEVLVNGVSYLNNEAFDGETLTLEDIQSNMTVQAYFQIMTYTVETEATVGGTITETAVYNCGTDVVIAITPDACYNIDSVMVDGVDQGEVTEVTFDALDTNHTVNVYFSMKTYVVTASVNDSTFGTITATDTFNCGETPTYEITANEGYHIVGVEVDGEDQGPITSYTFGALSEDHTITANFEINTYTLTVNANAGVEISPVAGDTIVEFGASVTYEFTVDSCYEISAITVDGENIEVAESYTFDSVTDNHVLMVTTTLKTYTITATATEGGTITPAGEVTVECGGTQSFSFTPAVGYRLDSVMVDDENVGVVYNYVFSGVTEDHTIEVFFASNDSNTYTITATAGENGTITPEGDTTVYEGTSITYVFTADEYYTIDSVIVDGNLLPTPVRSYTFSNIMADHTIRVTFVADQMGCTTPGIVYTTNITETSATLNWNDTEAASYTIRYKKLSDTAYTVVTGITDVTYDLTGLDEATEYVWNVKAVCVDSVAESAWSVSVTFVTEETIDTTGIHTEEMSSINVYSYGNDIYVTNESNEQIKDVQVYDMNGRMIHRGMVQSNPEVINVTAANGIYIVRVVTNTMVRNFKVSITQR